MTYTEFNANIDFKRFIPYLQKALFGRTIKNDLSANSIHREFNQFHK